MLGDKSGARIWSTSEPSDSRQRIPGAVLLFNYFFPAEIRARGRVGRRESTTGSPLCQMLKRAECQTLDACAGATAGR